MWRKNNFYLWHHNIRDYKLKEQRSVQKASVRLLSEAAVARSDDVPSSFLTTHTSFTVVWQSLRNTDWVGDSQGCNDPMFIFASHHLGQNSFQKSNSLIYRYLQMQFIEFLVIIYYQWCVRTGKNFQAMSTILKPYFPMNSLKNEPC